MMSRLVVPLLCLLFASAHAGWMDCVKTMGGVTYDLGVLWDDDVDIIGSADSWNYRMNPCGSAHGTCLGKAYDPMICQESKTGYFESVIAYGDTDKTPAPLWTLIDPSDATRGVRLTFRNGDYCWASPSKETVTIINFRCDREATDRPDTLTIYQEPACTFHIDYPSRIICPSQLIESNIYRDLSGLFWDLNPLASNQTDFRGKLDAYDYGLNVGNLIAKQDGCRTANHSICQYSFRGEFIAGLGGFWRKPRGSWSYIAADPTVGIRQTYRNGEPCVIGGELVPRTSIINYYCDPKGTPEFKMTSDPADCTFVFDFHVPEGCPHRF